MFLEDTEITRLCHFPDTAMIKPFFPVSKTTISEDAIRCTPGLVCPSYGLSSAGYDIRVSDRWMFPDAECAHEVYDTCRTPGAIVNNANVKFISQHDSKYVLMPGKFTLAVSMEEFKMPDDVIGICMGKSTLARMGIMVFVTPLETSWEGYLTLEIFNAGSNPVVLHAGMGICQINFAQLRNIPHKSYMNRSGKYQGQPNVPVMARV